MRISNRSLLTLCLAGLVACGSSEDSARDAGSDAGTQTNPDQRDEDDGGTVSPTDDGGDQAEDGGQAPDAGPRLGKSGEACEQGVTGEGCEEGLICQVDVARDSARCAKPGPQTYLKACNEYKQDCGAGLACISVRTQEGPMFPTPVCMKVCDIATKKGCESVKSSCDLYYPRPDGTQPKYGMCTPVDQEACHPERKDCPEGQTCTMVSPNSFRCAPAGTAKLGDLCEQNNCEAPNICLKLYTPDPVCHEPCDPASTSSSCPANQGCLPMSGLDFGLCRDTCDPVDPEACPQGRTCQSVGRTARICSREGNAELGAACGPGIGDCKRPYNCMNINRESLCRKNCRKDSDCGSGQTCASLNGLDYGFCMTATDGG